ncbi:unnamed protein product [Rotaria socialis]
MWLSSFCCFSFVFCLFCNNWLINLENTFSVNRHISYDITKSASGNGNEQSYMCIYKDIITTKTVIRTWRY